jgi:hypothetical protein
MGSGNAPALRWSTLPGPRAVSVLPMLDLEPVGFSRFGDYRAAYLLL